MGEVTQVDTTQVLSQGTQANLARAALAFSLPKSEGLQNGVLTN